MALINCPECSKEISDVSSACIHCGYPLKNGLSPEEQLELLELFSEVEEEENEVEDLLMDEEEFLCCPKCYSRNLTPMKKGFSFGKALAGVATVGLYGIAVGAIGKDNIRLFCNGCGNRFKSTNSIKLTRLQQKYFKENM